jgi:lipoate-protein ligase A
LGRRGPARLPPRQPALAPPRHEDWYAWALAPAIATFRAFGLEVERRAEDLWHDGRKIAGSGAATIGRCAVVASSFLCGFRAERLQPASPRQAALSAPRSTTRSAQR